MSDASQAPTKSIVIAVDGPAASGKGTIARALARHFGLPHLDTGMLYRAVALNLWLDEAADWTALSAAHGKTVAIVVRDAGVRLN